MTDAEDQLAHLFEAYRTAVLLKDVDRMIALYADDVRLFDAWNVWVCEGASLWRKTVEQWFESLDTDTVHVSFEDARAEGGAALVVASATVTFAAFSQAGERLRSMRNRMTWALAQRSGSWKIVHQHSSLPIDLDSFKGILEPDAQRA